MKDLAKTIEMAAEHEREYTLREAAAKWAIHCIDTHDGRLLRKGLAISAALAEYMNEFES